MVEILSTSPALLCEMAGYVACVGLLLTFALLTGGWQDNGNSLPGWGGVALDGSRRPEGNFLNAGSAMAFSRLFSPQRR
jgi:hypothetical protein